MPTQATTGPGRLAGLDGIRGLAALFVVAHHTFLRSFPGYPRDTAPGWAGWLIYGHLAVVVFIVLSGFSLAAAPARSGWRLGGLGAYARRRARRILPAYWGALVFSLLVAWFITPQPGQAVPGATSAVVNALLVQDLVDAPTPNRAFWTIAIEAQLYLVLPLLLLAVRRVGAALMLAGVALVVVAVEMAATRLSTVEFLLRVTPQFAALFALGVAAAGVLAASRRRQAWPWPWLALATGAPVLAVIALRGSVWTLGHLFWVDLALGPAIGCLLASIATGRPARLVRLLHTRPLRTLGGFSYSLYLTHAPIVMAVWTLAVAGRVPRGVPSFLVSLAIVVPLTVAFAWAFAAVFEVPFQRRTAAAGARPRPMTVAVAGAGLGLMTVATQTAVTTLDDGDPGGPSAGGLSAGGADRDDRDTGPEASSART